MSVISGRAMALQYKDYTYVDIAELHRVRSLVIESLTDEHSDMEADHADDEMGGDVK
jgi:hypothetical protein